MYSQTGEDLWRYFVGWVRFTFRKCHENRNNSRHYKQTKQQKYCLRNLASNSEWNVLRSYLNEIARVLKLEKLKQANGITVHIRVNLSKCSVLLKNANKNWISHIYAIKVRSCGRARVTGSTKHGRRHRVRVCTALETIQRCHCQCLRTLYHVCVLITLLLITTVIICGKCSNKTNEHRNKYVEL